MQTAKMCLLAPQNYAFLLIARVFGVDSRCLGYPRGFRCFHIPPSDGSHRLKLQKFMDHLPQLAIFVHHKILT